MMDKVLFWLDADLTAFCIAQKLAEFKKTWFYHDVMNQKIKSEPNYLKSFEEKYDIDLWQLAKNDRIFIYDYNNFYKFSEHEISEIMEKECKLFEEVLDQVKPDFFYYYRNCIKTTPSILLIVQKERNQGSDA